LVFFPALFDFVVFLIDLHPHVLHICKPFQIWYSILINSINYKNPVEIAIILMCHPAQKIIDKTSLYVRICNGRAKLGQIAAI